MKVRSSNVSTSISTKDGKHYASILVSILTDDGHTRDIEMNVPTPVEDWDETNYQDAVVNKYRGKERHMNKPFDI